MSRIARSVAPLVAAVLLTAGCSESDDDSTSEPVVSADASTTTTTEAPVTTTAPTSTTEPTSTTTTRPTTTTQAPTTTTEAPATTTTVADDTDAPAAPTGLVCSPGGGSGEVTLDWDAPADPSDVSTVQIYMSDAGGPFTRLHTYTPAELLVADGSGWRANVFPIVFGSPIELAVTYDDAAGNESGWNPVDAWVPFAGAGCNSGAPAAPTITRAERSAGSGEVLLTVDVPAADIAEWSVDVDQGSGWVPITTAFVQIDFPGPGQVGIDIWPVDWSLPATYRVVATDHHGNASPLASRDCPTPISPGDVAC